MSITSSSVQVEMNICVWTANKVDRVATDNVTNDNHAIRNAAQVRKNLMAGTVARKNIADHSAATRVWHNKNTLPWADRGARLLPTSLFMDYKSEANIRRDTFNTMVSDFLNNYPSLRSIAQNYLGDLYDADDYPSAEEIRDKFSFRMVFSPVPSSGDFRLDVPAQELDEMKMQYDNSFKDRMADAMREPWDRLHKVLTTMSDRLTEPDNEEEKKRYFTSLVTNAQDLCGMLTHLNVTNDPILEDARRQLETTMAGADIKTIKENCGTRGEMKRNVDAILSKFDW